MKNWMTEKLLPHVGHEISCVAYGDRDDPSDVRIECEDCYTVLVSAEDFNQVMAGDYKITQRLQQQVETLKQQRAERGLPFTALTMSHCRKRQPEESLVGKLIILRPSSLAPEYRSADYQLGYALSGFGCQPNAVEDG